MRIKLHTMWHAWPIRILFCSGRQSRWRLLASFSCFVQFYLHIFHFNYVLGIQTIPSWAEWILCHKMMRDMWIFYKIKVIHPWFICCEFENFWSHFEVIYTFYHYLINNLLFVWSSYYVLEEKRDFDWPTCLSLSV